MMAETSAVAGLSFSRAFLDCRDTLKRVTEPRLDQIVEYMQKRKTIPRKLGKLIKTSKQGPQSELLLGWVSKTVDNFVVFLDALTTVASGDKQCVDLMKILSRSLPSVRATPGSETESKISGLIVTISGHLAGQTEPQKPVFTPTQSEHGLQPSPATELPERTGGALIRTTHRLQASHATELSKHTEEAIAQIAHGLQPTHPTELLERTGEALTQTAHVLQSSPATELPECTGDALELEVTTGTVNDHDSTTGVSDTDLQALPRGNECDDIQPTACSTQPTEEPSPDSLKREPTLHHGMPDSNLPLDTVTATEPANSPTETVPSGSAVQSDEAALQPHTAQLPPVPPPSGHIGRLAVHITASGGVLYSPEYGIMITVPETALPSSIDAFTLSIHVYLRGPFAIPDDTELCTPVVWVALEPNFTFVADVTLKLSHSALIPPEADLNQLSLWTARDLLSPTYELSQRVDADFSDGYHVIAHVRHFSPYAATVKKNKKPRRASDTRRSRSKNTVDQSHQSSGQQQAQSPVLPCDKRKQVKRLQRGSLSVERNDSVDSDECTGSQEPVSMETSSAASPAEQLSMHSQSPISQTTMQLEQMELSRTEHMPQASNSSSDENVAVKSTHLSPPDITNEFVVAMCVPRERSRQTWEAVFYVSYDHATGRKAIRQTAISKFGGDIERGFLKLKFRRFQFASDDVLNFLPLNWSENGWRVLVTDGHQIYREDLGVFASNSPADEFPLDFVSYAVQASYPRPPVPLCCTVQVQGVLTRGSMEYVLTSTSPTAITASIGSRTVTVNPHLYSEGSEVLDLLTQPTGDLNQLGLILGNLLDDHRKLLAELSLQTNKPRKIASQLQVRECQVERILADYPDDEAEQIYHLLTAWAAREHSNATLQQLLDFLELQLKMESIASDLNFEAMPKTWYNIIVDISEKLQKRWKFVARLLGIAKPTVEAIVHDNRRNLGEQSHQMLFEWKRQHGSNATYPALMNAVCTVYAHDPDGICDAYLYLEKNLLNS